MILSSLRVRNFKAISDVEIDLTTITLLVGANNSGKSSFLQAVHFASRCLAQASEANKQSTLSLRELEYVPTQLYYELANNDKWGNRLDQPESKVNFTLRNEQNEYNSADVSLKSARNEGISIDPSVSPSLIQVLRSKNSMFSAYIPGLAGIPLEESFMSKRHVYRKAASGDSNVVLRNILYLLDRAGRLNDTIKDIQELYYDSRIEIKVHFHNSNDYFISSKLELKVCIIINQ